MNLQETLRQNRINRHLTQGSVARRLNVRQQMVSKIEKNPGVSLISVVRYAECIGDEVIVVPKVSKQFENSYLYNKYMELQSHGRVILSHVAALEALGLFSGYSNEYTVEYYALSSVEVNNTQFHPVGRLGFNAIGSVYTKGVYCTDINRTINDVLVNSDRIDDTPILESLNTYYYENGESFDNLLLTEEARQSLEKYKEDAIYYYDKATDD